MSNIRSLIIVALVVCGFYASCTAMVYDNRYFPLFNRPYVRTCEQRSRFAVDVFFMTADNAYGDREQDIGLYELFGFYDQKKLGLALMKVGLPNALLDEWRALDIPWHLRGKLQAQGVAMIYDQALTNLFSTGFSLFFMRATGAQRFEFNNSTLRFTPSDELTLGQERRQMHQTLGLNGPLAHQTGISDIDWYLRVGSLWDYVLKCRRIDAGFRLGALIPSGLSMDINSPASVPFGGNGFAGIYGSIDADFELKEDLNFGLLLRLNKRFARTKKQRLPVADEPQIFGALVSDVRIDPGFTVVFSPYLSVENIRAGFGGRLNYTLTAHTQDEWKDLRSVQEKQALPVDVFKLEDQSGWMSDYVTLSAFYNFGAGKVDSGMNPTFVFSWDIPALLFKAYGISKTQRISLSLEAHF